MRFTKKQMQGFNQDETFRAYGWTDCINELLIWLKTKEKNSCHKYVGNNITLKDFCDRNCNECDLFY